jgi:tetratricopeptide (TPR) repeat protein
MVGSQAAGQKTRVPTSPRITTIEGLGSLSFPNSGSEEAQAPFLRGVLLLHSFEYEPAAESFREAQAADSGFVLAYWGEAMTYNHPLWRQRDYERGRAALARLAPTPEERRALAGTEREVMYLDAVEELYAGTTKSEEDLAYMDAMKKLHEAYPGDMEARAFYALSILGSSGGLRDFATYMRAAFTAQPVFDQNPNHPGAAHYIIHSFDDPIHAPLGLNAARAYSSIAPNAAHAQHMTTHIFVALGMWEDVVAGNIRARNSQDAERAQRGRRPNVCGHYSSWLHYGHLMLGQLDEAESLMDACHERTMNEPSSGEWFYFVNMRARHIVDTEQWDHRRRWVADPPDNPVGGAPDESRSGFFYGLTNAYAALRDGDQGPARAFLAGYETPTSEGESLQIEQLHGLLAIADGRVEEGLDQLRKAAEAESAMPIPFGPPSMVKPTFELLGEQLVRAGRTEEAADAYRRAAARTPGRPLAEKAG